MNERQQALNEAAEFIKAASSEIKRAIICNLGKLTEREIKIFGHCMDNIKILEDSIRKDDLEGTRGALLIYKPGMGK